jgi:hypothetical protein
VTWAIVEQGLQVVVCCKQNEGEQQNDSTDGVLTEEYPFLPSAQSSHSLTSISQDNRALCHGDNYKAVN